MIAIKLLVIFFTLHFNWSFENNSIDYVFFKVDSKTFKSIYHNEVIIPYQLSENDKSKVIQHLNTHFDQIRKTLALPNTYNINDYRLQLITGINTSKEKVVFISFINKNLPKWIFSNWHKQLIQLKCVGDNMLNIKMNITTEKYYDMVKHDCE
jgi:hypothetical protein